LSDKIRDQERFQTRTSQQADMQKYILTGAPGAGKTAILRQLEMDGYSVVEEAATGVIALWRAKGVADPWTRPEFIDAVVSLQQTRERRAACVTELVQFYDRCVVCTAALADYLQFPRPQSLRQELQRMRAQNVFQRRVLFVRNLGFVTPTEARRITYAETVRFEQIHERTYRDLGFEITSIDPGSVSDRVRQIKCALSLERT
jgi:predicted ATPase